QARLIADAQILRIDQGNERRTGNAMHANRTLYLRSRYTILKYDPAVSLAVEGTVTARDAEGEAALDGCNRPHIPAADDLIEDGVIVSKSFASTKGKIGGCVLMHHLMHNKPRPLFTFLPNSPP